MAKLEWFTNSLWHVSTDMNAKGVQIVQVHGAQCFGNAHLGILFFILE